MSNTPIATIHHDLYDIDFFTHGSLKTALRTLDDIACQQLAESSGEPLTPIDLGTHLHDTIKNINPAPTAFQGVAVAARFRADMEAAILATEPAQQPTPSPQQVKSQCFEAATQVVSDAAIYGIGAVKIGSNPVSIARIDPTHVLLNKSSRPNVASPQHHWALSRVRDYAVNVLRRAPGPTHMSDYDIAVMIADLIEQPETLDRSELYGNRMAGITTATLGYGPNPDKIHPEFNIPAYRDAYKLYGQYDNLFQMALAAGFGYDPNTQEWSPPAKKTEWTIKELQTANTALTKELDQARAERNRARELAEEARQKYDQIRQVPSPNGWYNPLNQG